MLTQDMLLLIVNVCRDHTVFNFAATHILGEAVLLVEVAELHVGVQVTEGDQVVAAPLYLHSSARRMVQITQYHGLK